MQLERPPFGITSLAISASPLVRFNGPKVRDDRELLIAALETHAAIPRKTLHDRTNLGVRRIEQAWRIGVFVATCELEPPNRMEPTVTERHRPTQAELKAAKNKTVPDVIGPGLRVLFCGINPGLYTAAIGHHFGRPGNRFWPALHAAGFTPRLLDPSEEQELVPLGFGITNVVARATAAADELTAREIVAGGRVLVAKVRQYAPRYLAVLGIGAYRTAFAHPKALVGLQPDPIGETRVWVLPNPSGLNAHYPGKDLVRVFRELQKAVGM